MNRQREKEELLCMLGMLFGPVLKVAEHPEQYEGAERTRIIARFFHEKNAFTGAVDRFAKGEPGHSYYAHYARVLSRCNRIAAFVNNTPDDEAGLFALVEETYETIRDTISDIPVPLESTIHEASTPFSTYCLIRDICLATTTELMWVDRYFDCGLFHRYLRGVPRDVLVTLVTWPDTKLRGKADQDRFSAFLGVSALFAHERGGMGYRLIVNEAIHDRWLLSDDRLFELGGSVKDLGKETTFTMSRLDSTEENRRKLDQFAKDGAELFGPSVATHP